MPELPIITYITGLSILTTDSDGVAHSIVIEAKDPHNIESSCPPGVSPCLADGSLRVVLDGVETLSAPGSVTLGKDLVVSAVNIPGQCRSFGFEKYWERKKLENERHGRRLGEPQGMGEWVLGVSTIHTRRLMKRHDETAASPFYFIFVESMDRIYGLAMSQENRAKCSNHSERRHAADRM